ncbi:hypothetical protein M378DRAFT_171612 [Amanita muscaria Koide BX008]|uniref:Uncharacterized protein n=1 Tax=Amanita muscaria (strain Koide BX008) TaxID=946122 RepID=A0A0C2W8Q3_AMAMK|nr:hypothetical protein M378DRAFT_171612 [Amanita muscaria Koide BX008]
MQLNLKAFHGMSQQVTRSLVTTVDRGNRRRVGDYLSEGRTVFVSNEETVTDSLELIS